MQCRSRQSVSGLPLQAATSGKGVGTKRSSNINFVRIAGRRVLGEVPNTTDPIYTPQPPILRLPTGAA